MATTGSLSLTQQHSRRLRGQKPLLPSCRQVEEEWSGALPPPLWGGRPFQGFRPLLSPSASVTGSLSNQSPTPSVHTMSSNRLLSASDEDSLQSLREVDHDSEVHSSDNLCDDVSSREGSSSVSISESLSNVSEDESETEAGWQSQPHDASPLFPQAHVLAEGFEVAFMSLVQRHNMPVNLIFYYSTSTKCVLVAKFINYKKDDITGYYCGSCLS